MQTTDFDAFLAEIALDADDIEAIYSLHRAANGQSDGDFEAVGVPPDKLNIKHTPTNAKLFLASPTARAAFIKVVENLNPHPDMSIDGALIYVRAMQKDD